MKLTTNVNLENPITIDRSSVITGINGCGKSSILNSVEMALYGTVNNVKPKSKGVTDFVSDCSIIAKELNIADIIYCRFLELAPMDKRKILLELIVDDEIKTNFGSYWSGNVTDSIKAVKDKNREFKKAIQASEMQMKILEDQNDADNEKLKEYKGVEDVDFEIKDVDGLVKRLSDLKGLMDSSKKSGTSLIDKTCVTCKQSLPKKDEDEITLKALIEDYKRYEKEYAEKYKEWQEAVEYNKKGKEAHEIKIKLTEKRVIEGNIKIRDDQIIKLVEKLTELQKDGSFNVVDYVENKLFGEISKKFSLKDFELDLEKGFKVKYKDQEYSTMSRGQKYACSIYFSIGLLRQLDCRILVIDDAEMLHPKIQKEIIKEIKDFDFLVAIVTDTDLQIK